MNKLSCGAVRGVKFFEFFRLVHGDVQHGVQRMGACAAGIVTAGGGESRRGRRNGMEQTQILTPRIGSEEIRRAAQILKKYREGKIQLERRIIDNEQFWKLRHWQQM